MTNKEDKDLREFFGDYSKKISDSGYVCCFEEEKKPCICFGIAGNVNMLFGYLEWSFLSLNASEEKKARRSFSSCRSIASRYSTGGGGTAGHVSANKPFVSGGRVSFVEYNSSIGALEAVFYSFVDEVLSVLKNNYSMYPAARKTEINEFLKGKAIPDMLLFNPMVTTASLIKVYLSYKPKSTFPPIAYSMLLNVVHHVLTYPQPEIVKKATMNEVLRIMKNPELGSGRDRGTVAVKEGSDYHELFVPEECIFQPNSEETEAYQALVSVMVYYSIGSPEALLYSFADEVLSVLKNSHITDPAVKKAKINEFLKGKGFPGFLFNQMALLMRDYPSERLGRGGDQLEVNAKSTSDSSCDDLPSTKSEAATVFSNEDSNQAAGKLGWDSDSDEDTCVLSDNEESEAKSVYSNSEGDAVDVDKEAANNNEESEAKSVYSDDEKDIVDADKVVNNSEGSEAEFVHSNEDAEADVSGLNTRKKLKLRVGIS